MKISIAICTHNEGEYIGDLLNRLVKVADSPDFKHTGHSLEIVLVDDNSTDAITNEFLIAYEFGYPHLVKHYKHSLSNDFAAHKNFMNSMCTGDWILNLDADEWLPENVLEVLPLIIESNPEVEAYWLPRVNTVDGLTQKHVQKWKWVVSTLDGFRTAKMIENVDEYEFLKQYGFIIEEKDGVTVFNQPIIMWPDPQMRLYKNVDRIKWKQPVHELLVGFEHYSQLPNVPEYAIRHFKDIHRQEKQNNYYQTFV